jgi:hypothetical protein
MAVRGDAKMTGDGFRHAPVHLIVLGDPRVKETYRLLRQTHLGRGRYEPLKLVRATGNLLQEWKSNAISITTTPSLMIANFVTLRHRKPHPGARPGRSK